MHQYSLSKHIYCIYYWNREKKFSLFCMWFLRAVTAIQVKLSSNLWILIDLLIMFKHFSSQNHVRTDKYFQWITRKNSRGIFMKLLFWISHNLRTQRTHTIKYNFFLHFRNQKEMACAIKTAEWEIRRGNHRFFQIFFSLIFFWLFEIKKVSYKCVCVLCIHQNVCGETHERNENENVIFPRLQLCTEKKKKKIERKWKEKDLKNVHHRPQIAAIVGDSFTNFLLTCCCLFMLFACFLLRFERIVIR